MAPPFSSRDYGQFDELAEEFAERFRRGERPSLEEYIDRLPGMADEIREIFPGLAEIERAKPDGRGQGVPALPGGMSQDRRIGDYRIVREVGRGGMGIVYQAEQLSLGRQVALKVLPGHIAAHRKSLERFRREAKAAARLHHTNIVPVFEVGQDGEIAFYTMQLIHGQGLDEVIDELARLRGPCRETPDARPDDPTVVETGLPERPLARLADSLLSGRLEAEGSERTSHDPAGAGDADETEPGVSAATVACAPAPITRVHPFPSLAPATHVPARLPGGTQISSTDSSGLGRPYFQSVAMIGRQAAQGLAFAHARGVVHRDVKPSNLLLDTAGVVWITDFGLAKAESEDDGLTATGDVLGTLRYMAPERFRGDGDARADVYSLGLTLYELAALRPAHQSSDRVKLIEQIKEEEPARPRTLDARVPRDLETIILKAIEKEPERRYQSAEALAEDLRRFLADEPIWARRTSMAERYSRWARRNPGIAVLGVALTAVLTAVAVGSSIAAARFRGVANDMIRLAREKEAQRAAAVAAKGQADEARRDADRQRELAVRTLYFAESNMVSVALTPGIGPPRMGRFVREWRNRADLGDDARAWEWSYFNSPPRNLKRVLHGHKENVMTLAWSPDGRRIATGGFNDVIHIWDAATGALARTIPGSGPSATVVWSPDGRLVAETTYFSKLLRIWEVDSGLSRLAIPIAVGVNSTLAWSPDGKRLATGSEEDRRPVQVWDAASGRLLLELEEGGEQRQVAWSPDGRYLAGAGLGCSARVWDGGTGKLTVRLGAPSPRSCSVAWSPDGARLACGSKDGTIGIWDVEGRRRVRTSKHSGGMIRSVAWRRDGRRIAFSGPVNDPYVRIWKVEGDGSKSTVNAHPFGVMGVAWNPVGAELASAGGGWNGDVKIWREDEPWEQTSTAGAYRDLMPQKRLAIAWSPTDSRLALGTDGGMVRIRDAATGQETDLARAGPFWPRVMCWNPTGTRLAVTNNPREKEHPLDGESITVFDAAAKKAVLTLPNGPGPIQSLSWSPDDKTLLTGHRYEDETPTIRLWNATTGQMLAEYPGAGAAWSPDGRRFAIADRYGLVVRDAAGAEVASWFHPSNLNAIVRWSPDSRLLAVPYGNSVDLWDAETGRSVRSLDGHTLEVRSVAWHPSGERLATGGEDGTVRIWDARTGSLVLTFRGRGAVMLDVAWSADGLRLAASSRDRTVTIWDATTGAEADHTPDLLPSLAARLKADPNDVKALRRRAVLRARLGEWDEAAADFEHAAAIAGKRGPGWSGTGWFSMTSAPDDDSDPFDQTAAKQPRWYANADDPNGFVPVLGEPPLFLTRIHATAPRDINLRTDRYVLISRWNGRRAVLKPGTQQLTLRKGWNTLVLQFAESKSLGVELSKPGAGLYARLDSDDRTRDSTQAITTTTAQEPGGGSPENRTIAPRRAK